MHGTLYFVTKSYELEISIKVKFNQRQSFKMWFLSQTNAKEKYIFQVQINFKQYDSILNNKTLFELQKDKSLLM